MIFTEAIFFVFLVAVFAAYWLLKKHREWQLRLLLVASAIFYGWWDWRFLLLIGTVVLISWVTAQQVSKHQEGASSRRAWLIFGVTSSLTILGVFKYFNFFADSSIAMLQAIGLTPSTGAVHILLPVGISFYIFQAISYIVDTARGDLKAEKRLSRVALYIAFFPQLVAGPIVRAASFFPQMGRTKPLSRGLIAAGLRAFLLGFAYKAGIADNLAQFVDPVFGNALVPNDADLTVWSNGALVGASLAFAGQIYFDFAGYSLMAIGVARWFGFYIPKNFDYPYASTNIADFWRRWHISLSSWLRDYLYIPLGGNRSGRMKTYRNLMITMVLGGLWHGAAWTFVAWGALHGLALAVHRALFISKARRMPAIFALIATQLFVLLAWVPFRAESFGDTLTAWSAFVGLRTGGPEALPWIVWAVPALIILDACLGHSRLRRLARSSLMRRPMIFWGGLGVLTAILFALYPLEAQPFVYFQF